MRPRILITGGSGLLALNWAAAVRDRFDVILGLHDRNINFQGVKSVRINLESIKSVQAMLERISPSWVVHAAGLTSVERCELNPILARHINVNLARNVAIACGKLRLPLVHISTDHLFCGNFSFVDEDFPVAPVNMYGQTKLEAEISVLEECFGALVIRTNFYGWGTSYRQSFSDKLINSLRLNQKVNLFQDVYYTPVLVEVLINLINELVHIKARGVFNIVGDDRVSKYEFGLRLAKEFNLDISLIGKDQIANKSSLVKRPYDMSLSNKKVKNVLGYSIGSLDAQLSRLKQQEFEGLARELRNL